VCALLPGGGYAELATVDAELSVVVVCGDDVTLLEQPPLMASTTAGHARLRIRTR